MLSAAKIQEVLDRARASEVSRIGGNSTITHVVIGSQEYAVKDYSARLDGDQRLATEFAALELLRPRLPGRFAEPLGIGPDSRRAIYSWIPGRPPSLDHNTVHQMLAIARELHAVSHDVDHNEARAATDQVLAVEDVIHQLRTRVDDLATAPPVVADFARLQVRPAIDQLAARSAPPSQAAMTLSLSDFGAHNLLWDEQDRMMRCVDLEFFGWDDAHKLTCDTLLHPLAQWTERCAEMFLTGASAIYSLDAQRLVRLWPWLCLKWSTITLGRAARDLRSGRRAQAAEAMLTARTYLSRSQESGIGLGDIVAQISDGRRGP